MKVMPATLSALAAIFIGWMQWPWWALIPVSIYAGIATYRYKEGDQPPSIILRSIAAFFILTLVEWVARLASFYVSGHQFAGPQ